MPSVSVTINGKSYRMACDEGQEAHLQELAASFNQYVEHLKNSFGEIGDQRLTVMAGVMVTDELYELRKKIDGLEAQLKDLKKSRDNAIDMQDDLQKEIAEKIGKAAEKIETLAVKLTNGGGGDSSTKTAG